MEKIPFTDDNIEEVKSEAEARGLVHIEDQRHVDGDFLLYGTPEEASGRKAERLASAIAGTDARMARVAEDIYEVLKAKGMLADADMPSEALDVMGQRRAIRVLYR